MSCKHAVVDRIRMPHAWISFGWCRACGAIALPTSLAALIGNGGDPEEAASWLCGAPARWVEPDASRR